VTATQKPWDRYLDDRRSERVAELNEHDETYYRPQTDAARADRERLWREGIPSCCAVCLKPTEPSYDLCPTCEHDEDVSADHYRRDHM
jgi:hypothetical protein